MLRVDKGCTFWDSDAALEEPSRLGGKHTEI
jgi:hypothetical protein